MSMDFQVYLFVLEHAGLALVEHKLPVAVGGTTIVIVQSSSSVGIIDEL
ncbi:17333_t:CDS:2 [Funneliformis geosporum]|uniref:17333_t:CDS:1 n=1 Tax=Funneliformis geosporum TaxID=1117311 RepID=A0A9W4WK33_9GLOM|nr:17333_t:CDS:2 [Funneliformis geosporum]